MYGKITHVILAVVIATVGFCIADHAQAAIPKRMHYQGRLTDAATGIPLEGAHNLTFRIFDEGGVQLWSETKIADIDDNGLLSTILGSVNPIELSFSGPCSLEVEVDGQVLLPRREILSAAYSYHADDADKLGGVDASSYSLTANVVGSIAGVYSAGGDIDLIAGEGIAITPDDINDWITIEVSGTPGGGDITSVEAGSGLTGGGETGDVALHVGQGDGLDVTADAVSVAVADFAGNGLGETTNDLMVNTSTGLEISSDAVQLTTAYSTGGAYDSRFVGLTGNQTIGGTKTFSSQAQFTNGIQIPNPGPTGNAVRAYASGSSPTIWAQASGANAVYARCLGDNVAIYGVANNSNCLNVRNTSSGYGTVWSQNDGHGIALRGQTGNSYALKVVNDSDEYPAIYAENLDGDSYYFTGIHCEMPSSGHWGITTNARGYFGGGTSAFTSLSTTSGQFLMTAPLVPEIEIHISGSAALTSGTASVRLDPTLADAVAQDVPMKVIVTPTAMCNGLAVTEKAVDGFVVRELAGGVSNSTFDWLVIARKAVSASDRSAKQMPQEPPAARRQPESVPMQQQ